MYRLLGQAVGMLEEMCPMKLILLISLPCGVSRPTLVLSQRPIQWVPGGSFPRG
jgi:hypothetical protein